MSQWDPHPKRAEGELRGQIVNKIHIIVCWKTYNGCNESVRPPLGCRALPHAT
jgi:hypothetical protein